MTSIKVPKSMPINHTTVNFKLPMTKAPSVSIPKTSISAKGSRPATIKVVK